MSQLPRLPILKCSGTRYVLVTCKHPAWRWVAKPPAVIAEPEIFEYHDSQYLYFKTAHQFPAYDRSSDTALTPLNDSPTCHKRAGQREGPYLSPLLVFFQCAAATDRESPTRRLAVRLGRALPSLIDWIPPNPTMRRAQSDYSSQKRPFFSWQELLPVQH